MAVVAKMKVFYWIIIPQWIGWTTLRLASKWSSRYHLDENRVAAMFRSFPYVCLVIFSFSSSVLSNMYPMSFPFLVFCFFRFFRRFANGRWGIIFFFLSICFHAPFFYPFLLSLPRQITVNLFFLTTLIPTLWTHCKFRPAYASPRPLPLCTYILCYARRFRFFFYDTSPSSQYMPFLICKALQARVKQDPSLLLSFVKIRCWAVIT